LRKEESRLAAAVFWDEQLGVWAELFGEDGSHGRRSAEKTVTGLGCSSWVRQAP
jgi:hypothetical protein